jgi:fatty aldehyde-generating acyl-ACP reductase
MYLDSRQPPWFAFLVHPRDVAEFLRCPGGSLIRRYSESDEEFVRKAMSTPPVVSDEVSFTGSAVCGEIVGIPRLPEAILTPDGCRAVIQAVDVAVGRGAAVVGLGALTAPVTAGGRALLRHVPSNVTITNGNGLTAAVAHRNVVEAMGWCEAGDGSRVAVLGATGSVGYALSHLLARDGVDLVLIGPTEERVERMFGDLTECAVAASGPMATVDADIVVVLTSDSSAILTPAAVAQGAIVIDLAQPCNIAEDALHGFASRGVTVARGGIVEIPGYSCTRDFGLSSRSRTFACLAETYLLAREGIREHAVGRPSGLYAKRMAEMADRHGVVVCPLEPAGRYECVEGAVQLPVCDAVENEAAGVRGA